MSRWSRWRCGRRGRRDTSRTPDDHPGQHPDPGADNGKCTSTRRRQAPPAPAATSRPDVRLVPTAPRPGRATRRAHRGRTPRCAGRHGRPAGRRGSRDPASCRCGGPGRGVREGSGRATGVTRHQHVHPGRAVSSCRHSLPAAGHLPVGQPVPGAGAGTPGLALDGRRCAGSAPTSATARRTTSAIRVAAGAAGAGPAPPAARGPRRNARQRVRRRLGEEHQVGQREHLPGDRASLRVVGVQQGPVRSRRRGEGQLPAQVDRVEDAGVHALAAGRGVGVRGVARQEERPAPEGLRQPVLQPDLRGPPQLRTATPMSAASRIRWTSRPGPAAPGCPNGARRVPPAGCRGAPGGALAQRERRRPGPARPATTCSTPGVEVPVELERRRGRPPRRYGPPCQPIPATRARCWPGRHSPRRTGARGLPRTVRGTRTAWARSSSRRRRPARRPAPPRRRAGERRGEHLLDVHLPEQREVREGGVPQRRRSASRAGTTRRPRCSSRGRGAVGPRSSSASATPSGRRPPGSAGCTIIAREGRNASGRRSTTRTVAPWACACSAVARPVGPAPTTRTSGGHATATTRTMPRPPPPLAREHGGVGEHVVPPQPGEDAVVDGARHADQPEHPPQRPGVVLGAASGAVPLVEAPVGPCSSWASHSLDTKPGKPTNSGVLSRLSTRNTCARDRAPTAAGTRRPGRTGPRRRPVDTTVSRYTRAVLPSAKRIRGRRSAAASGSPDVPASPRWR